MFFDTCVLALLQLIGISTTKKRALCGLHAHIAVSVLVTFTLTSEFCLLILLTRSEVDFSQIFGLLLLGLLIISDVLLLYGVLTHQPGYYDMFLYVKYASFLALIVIVFEGIWLLILENLIHWKSFHRNLQFVGFLLVAYIGMYMHVYLYVVAKRSQNCLLKPPLSVIYSHKT
ncbi:hypothetical protein M3Y96_00579100 [Aphelenchoides besseyi]|nr:hypothetical protein M3Y96_00579100 [Aphelenchoides besseyi]